MNNYIKRKLEKNAQWHNGVSKVQFSTSDNSLCIYIYPDINEFENVRLLTICKERFSGEKEVYIADLIGDVGKWCNRGYGTLLMNLLIQALKAIYPKNEHKDILIKGETSANGKDHLLKLNHFWSKFGLIINNPESFKSPMQCSLDELKCSDRGDISDHLSSMLSISNFYLTVNRPKLLSEDMKILSTLDINRDKFNLILPDSEIRSETNHAEKEYLKTLYMGFSILLISMGITIFYILPKIASLLMLLTTLSILLLFTIKNKWFWSIIPATNRIEELKKKQQYSLEMMVIKLDLVFKDPNFIYRIYSGLYAYMSDESRRKYFILAEDGKNGHLDPTYTNIKVITNMLTDLKEICFPEKIAISESDHNDFIFGNIKSLSESRLKEYVNILGEQYVFHIERFLKEISMLEVYGPSYLRLRPLLDPLKDNVAYVELYTDGDANKEICFLHAKVFLKNGIINFQPSWTAYKETRAEELVLALKDLEIMDLLRKTFICWDGKSLEKVSLSVRKTTEEVFLLLQEGNYSSKELDTICS